MIRNIISICFFCFMSFIVGTAAASSNIDMARKEDNISSKILSGNYKADFYLEKAYSNQDKIDRFRYNGDVKIEKDNKISGNLNGKSLDTDKSVSFKIDSTVSGDDKHHSITVENDEIGRIKMNEDSCTSPNYNLCFRGRGESNDFNYKSELSLTN